MLEYKTEKKINFLGILPVFDGNFCKKIPTKNRTVSGMEVESGSVRVSFTSSLVLTVAASFSDKLFSLSFSWNRRV